MTREEAVQHFEYGVSHDIFSEPVTSYAKMAIAALREQLQWISVEESMPDDWVSVLGYMTDAGEFPPVRECFAIDGNFWFPALHEIHPVSHWMPMPKKEEV